MKKEMACIGCPLSCHLCVELDELGNIIEVTGHTCKRGEDYVRSELTNPMRMLTSTVGLKGGRYNRIPVITSGQIPKSKLLDVMEEIRKTKVCAPVHVNDIIIENVCGLRVNIIASRSMEKITG